MLYNSLVAALACLAGTAIAAPACHAKSSPGAPKGGNGPNSLPFNGGYPQPNGPALTSLCYTRLGPSAVNGGPLTSWGWSTTSCVPTSTTVTTVSTSTPAPVTSTTTSVTTTTTTPSVIYHSFTTTSTVSVSVTTTTTLTATSTVTASTSTTTTTTVPAPPFFTPIQTALPGASYSGQYGGSNVTKREYPVDGDESPFGLKHNQPQFVSCAVYTSTSCSTSTSTVTSITQAPTPTTITTAISTSIVTTVPNVNVTITSMTTTTFTITASTTTTSTTTTTLTSTSTNSVYAACATNNFADKYNGVGISNADMSDTYSVNSAPATNMYDCCVAALLTPFSDNFVYDTKNGCYFATSTTCSNPVFAFAAKTSSNIRFAYGNLGCGSVNSIF